jgi:hypothetical protein
MKIDYKERKTKLIRENGRSADYTTPNFVLNLEMSIFLLIFVVKTYKWQEDIKVKKL